MPRTLRWRGVLAGAYLPGQLARADKRCLKHLVDESQPYPQDALCGGARADNLNDDDAAPTSSSSPCTRCVKRATAAGDAIPADVA